MALKKKRRESRYRFFVDMDGTLFPWNKNATREELLTAGYYINQHPFEAMVNALPEWDEGKDEVYICSSFLSLEALKGKNEALDKLAYYIPPERRIFVPYGTSKSQFVQKKLGCRLHRHMVLLDDHTPNLIEWEKAGGQGVKVLNGVNGSGQTWKGRKISAYTGMPVNGNSIISDPEILGSLIRAIYERGEEDLRLSKEGVRVDGNPPEETRKEVTSFLKSGRYLIGGENFAEVTGLVL